MQWILLLLLWLTHQLQVDSFTQCSGVSFCSRMRRQVLRQDSQYSADIANYTLNENIVTIPLSNAIGGLLDLQISILEGRKSRVKVLEKNHSRYELTDVLVKEFPAVNITATEDKDQGLLSLVPDYDKNFVVRVNGSSPFYVEFIYNDDVEVVLKGDRLVIKNEILDVSFSFDVEFEGAETLYGLFHHPYRLALGETADRSFSREPFRLRNHNVFSAILLTTMSMHGAIPVIYGRSPQRTSGIFLHNAGEQWVDISYSGNPSANFMVGGGTLDLFVMMGPTTKEVIRQYTDLTGTAHLPQLWALGYHQSCYSYQNQEQVKEVVANMDNNDIPMDAVWLDIDHTDGRRYFTWDPINFSDPEEMQRNLSTTNRKLVVIVEPHYKVEENYSFYAGALNEDLFLRWPKPDGRNYEDRCWPGICSWLDFLNPAGRDYYANWFSYDKFKGSTEVLAGIWLDQNEPGVFMEAYETTLPFGLLHIGGVEHRSLHNIYGFLQTMATHQGLMQRDNGEKRPFILSRSFFAGSQRYAATWTGSKLADWAYLENTYSECITGNLLGMVFCGADIGGQVGNSSEELLQRWYQAGIWLPFFRQHYYLLTNTREPYTYSEEVQNVIRNAIKIRYKHIPVWYTLFYEHSRYGDPLVRPFFYDYPNFKEQEDHILIGSDILARPVFRRNSSSITVTFPGNDTLWYRVDDESWSIHKGNSSEDVKVDINTSPYYYRAGSIIARKERSRSSTSDMRDDPLTLFVNLDENGNAEGRYYQDDYESFKYSTENNYFYVNFRYVTDTNSIRVIPIDGDSEGIAPILQGIIVHNITEGSEMKYTTNSDGVPLRNIEIAAYFSKTRSTEMTILL